MNSLKPLYCELVVSQEEIKEKMESDIKDNIFHFEIVKNALAKLYQNSELSPLIFSKKISQILTDLSNDDLLILEELPNKENNQLLHDSIFELVGIYKKIKSISALMNCNGKDKVLGKISINLAKVGDIDKATEVVHSIPDSKIARSARRDLAKVLAESGHVDKAIEMANTIPKNSQKKDSTLAIIFYELLKNDYIDLKNDDIDNAIKVVEGLSELSEKNKSPNYTPIKSRVLQKLVDALLKLFQVDKVLQLANTHPEIKNSALKDIIEQLAQLGDIDKALEMANIITDAKIKDQSLAFISMNIIAREEERAGSFD